MAELVIDIIFEAITDWLLFFGRPFRRKKKTDEGDLRQTAD